MKPFTPEEAQKLVGNDIPDEVIEAFQDLILKNLKNGVAKFKLSVASDYVAGKLGITKERLYEDNWMEVEPLFRRSGWKVVFDSPGYNETYAAFYVFSKGKS